MIEMSDSPAPRPRTSFQMEQLYLMICRQRGLQAVVSAMSGIGFEGLLVVQDPDGNVIEVLEQE